MNSKNLLHGGRLGTYRIYAFTTAILVLGLKQMVALAEPHDPWWLRLSVSGFFLLSLVLSFFSERVADRLSHWYGAGTILLGLWLTYLLYANQFHQDFMAGFNILSVVSVLLFDSRRMMLAFSVILGVALLAAAVAVDEGNAARWSFLVINFVLFLAGNLAVRMRASTRTKMEIELSNMLSIQEAAVESNSDAILMVDVDGNFIKTNSSFLRLWGLPRDFINANKVEEAEQVALSRVKDPAELHLIMSDGGSRLPIGEKRRIDMLDGRVVELYWRPMINADEVIGRLWYFRDVTQQYRFEETLLARERQLSRNNEILMQFATSFAASEGNLNEAYREITSVSAQLLEVDTVGVWFFDSKRKTMLLQLQYEKESGKFKSDVIVPMAAHPEYFADLLLSRVLVVRDTTQLASTSRFSQGKYSGRAKALMHAQIRARGECIGILSFECADTVRDWTAEDQNYAASLADLVSISLATEEKKLAQENLTNSLATLQAIFDLSETGIIVEDPDHNILNYNQLYLKIWNMTSEFIENNPYKDLLAHCLGMLKNSGTVEEGLERIKARPGMEYAGIMEFHDGRFVERYSRAVYVDGELKGRVWFYLDVTERKLKENELINRNFELDSFVYRASHDLKAPLNSVMGLISLIKAEEEVEPILRYITLMNKSVTKLDEFIRQLTQFSQDARLKVVRKSIDFRALLDDTLDGLKFMDNASRLHISMDIRQTGEFHSDPVRLGIVLGNLLSNAIKYQDLKKAQSFLRIEVEADHEQAVCRIVDNGVGISGEHLEKVFDLFYRASIQATGSGLGLYITHNAVHKLGGIIRVTSELGEGTTFVLSLPSLEPGEAPTPAELEDAGTATA